MKMKARLCLLILLLCLATTGMAKVTLQNGRFYDPVLGKVIAGRGIVYMQPEAMHHLFWANLDMTRVDADFELFKKRGFDCVVLKPNWGDFCPTVYNFDSGALQFNYSTTMFNRLTTLVDKAYDHGLYVLLMNGQATTPRLYTDAGQTLSTRIWTANYWVRFYALPYNPALYEDPNTFNLWTNFQYQIASLLSGKNNVLGYVIEPETSGTSRDLTTNEVYWWNYWVKQADPQALTGYTPITVNNTNCNMANTDVIFAGTYPTNQTEAQTASNVVNHLAAIRSYTSKPIFIRETGVTTYTYSATTQAMYLRAARNACEEAATKAAGYCFWMSRDFNATTFAAPQPVSQFDLEQAAYGLWDYNGNPKYAVNYWVDIAVPNLSFETLGSGSRPSGWESAWPWNGTPTGWSVTRDGSGPYDGSWVLRMFTGAGAPNAVLFCCNTNTLLQTLPNVPYTISAQMRYALATGHVYLAVLEYDRNGNLTQWEENSWTGGNWSWQKNSLTFTTHPNTQYCYVRFGIGGQQNEYLDVDKVEIVSAP